MLYLRGNSVLMSALSSEGAGGGLARAGRGQAGGRLRIAFGDYRGIGADPPRMSRKVLPECTGSSTDGAAARVHRLAAPVILDVRGPGGSLLREWFGTRLVVTPAAPCVAMTRSVRLSLDAADCGPEQAE